jgi:hypothetical protein
VPVEDKPNLSNACPGDVFRRTAYQTDEPAITQHVKGSCPDAEVPYVTFATLEEEAIQPWALLLTEIFHDADFVPIDVVLTIQCVTPIG